MDKGILIHAYIEEFYKHSKNVAEEKNMVPWKIEWKVGCGRDGEILRVDAVFRTESPDGKLHLDLYDWKISNNGTKKKLSRLEEYTTPQFSKYKSILENRTYENEQIIVDKMKICSSVLPVDIQRNTNLGTLRNLHVQESRTFIQSSLLEAFPIPAPSNKSEK